MFRVLALLPLPLLYAFFAFVAWALRVIGWRRDLVEQGWRAACPNWERKPGAGRCTSSTSRWDGSRPNSPMPAHHASQPRAADAFREPGTDHRCAACEPAGDADRRASLQLGMAAAALLDGVRRAPGRGLQARQLCSGGRRDPGHPQPLRRDDDHGQRSRAAPDRAARPGPPARDAGRPVAARA